MIVEDDGDNVEDDSWFEGAPSAPSMSHGVRASYEVLRNTFSEYLEQHQGIYNRVMHMQLREDLIEHLWHHNCIQRANRNQRAAKLFFGCGGSNVRKFIYLRTENTPSLAPMPVRSSSLGLVSRSVLSYARGQSELLDEI
ncbi:hypothetical protein BDK51DRAFT_45989 [Blyttiomyces helicus]|uniref:Uncharacterized protein n=1 Tax=Blyttiomyces helicus TaxID=388810 RepID=A0A4P9VU10_9FUNG|nr:hypothetical protein BDK51DRAFT_45989 [Blyttiomyces helicus]|eukprot:RKO83034.1 hypothetical protein BDK51DRAFT_45989 [Blyttiomyces helicus]